LSSKIPIAYIDIRTFAHATEDTAKVQTALHNSLPTELIQTISFQKTNLTGHHGNPITLFQTRVKDRKTAQSVLQKLAANLSIIDKEQLNNEIKQHLEKGNLYLRLDKQNAYLGQVKLCQTDPIHLRIHFRKHAPQEVIEICQKYGLLP
jgi:RNA binding exosome subunit